MPTGSVYPGLIKLIDQSSITLCTGTRNKDQMVPGVCYNKDENKVYVSWHFLTDSLTKLRLREVVV